MQRIPMTPRGHEAIVAELYHLKEVERRAVINAIAEARAHGDLKENAEYHAAKDRQGFVEGRIEELEAKLNLAEVIDVTQQKGNRVIFGATVKLLDEASEEEVAYHIVGEDEANIAQHKISYTAPLARALIGKNTGDTVTFTSPGGQKIFDILEVLYV
jgi:transcription elongation factor GreA